MRRRHWPLTAMLALGSACSTAQPKALAAVDAGPAAGESDAGSATAALPVTDAGSATAALTAVDAGATHVGSPPDARPVKSTVFDRLLAKPKERGFDPAEIEALIERRTGLDVEVARRTAGSWVMIQLAAAPGGRDQRDQQRAIEALKQLGVFEVVEGDRLMKVKVP